MLTFVEKYMKCLYGVLIAMLMVLLVFAVCMLGWQMIMSLTHSSPGLLANTDLLNTLGTFLLVLIAVELLEIMVKYLQERTIHVEIVVLLAIIAITRSVILLEPTNTDSLSLIGFGIIIISLAGAYFLIKKSGYVVGEKKTEPSE